MKNDASEEEHISFVQSNLGIAAMAERKVMNYASRNGIDFRIDIFFLYLDFAFLFLGFIKKEKVYKCNLKKTLFFCS